MAETSLRDAIVDLGCLSLLAFTATATPEIQKDIIKELALKDPVVAVTGIDVLTCSWKFSHSQC